MERDLTGRVAALAEPLLQSMGLELWGVELSGPGRPVLRVYIEAAPGGPAPGVEECAEASRLLGLSLDVEDFIPFPYVLELSTPGLDRRFFSPEQLAAHVGRPVEARLAGLSVREGGAGAPRRLSGLLLSAVPPEAAGGDWRFTLLPAQEEELRALSGSETGPGLCPARGGEGGGVEFAWREVKKARLLYLAPLKNAPGRKKGAREE